MLNAPVESVVVVVSDVPDEPYPVVPTDQRVMVAPVIGCWPPCTIPWRPVAALVVPVSVETVPVLQPASKATVARAREAVTLRITSPQRCAGAGKQHQANSGNRKGSGSTRRAGALRLNAGANGGEQAACGAHQGKHQGRVFGRIRAARLRVQRSG